MDRALHWTGCSRRTPCRVPTRSVGARLAVALPGGDDLLGGEEDGSDVRVPGVGRQHDEGLAELVGGQLPAAEGGPFQLDVTLGAFVRGLAAPRTSCLASEAQALLAAGVVEAPVPAEPDVSGDVAS